MPERRSQSRELVVATDRRALELFCHQAFIAPDCMPKLTGIWLRNVISEYYKATSSIDGSMRREQVQALIVNKTYHTHDVNQATIQIAAATPEIDNVFQALVVSLGHDSGRFPQAFVHNSLSDQRTKMWHAEASVAMLQGSLFHLTQKDFDPEVVIHAVANHSLARYGGDDPYAKLIRDADKYAILREITDQKVLTAHYEDGEIALPVLDAFMDGKPVLNRDVDNKAGVIMRALAWIHDFNFPATCRMVVNDRVLEPYLCDLQRADPKHYGIVADKVHAWEQSVLRTA